jgi:DNA-binding transcriptional regulator YdaS (Cro superfamily)
MFMHRRQQSSCVERLIAYFGSNLTEAATRLGQSKQVVSAWRRAGVIPPRHGAAIEFATGGNVTQMQVLEEHSLRALSRSRGRA